MKKMPRDGMGPSSAAGSRSGGGGPREPPSWTPEEASEHQYDAILYFTTLSMETDQRCRNAIAVAKSINELTNRIWFRDVDTLTRKTFDPILREGVPALVRIFPKFKQRFVGTEQVIPALLMWRKEIQDRLKDITYTMKSSSKDGIARGVIHDLAERAYEQKASRGAGLVPGQMSSGRRVIINKKLGDDHTVIRGIDTGRFLFDKAVIASVAVANSFMKQSSLTKRFGLISRDGESASQEEMMGRAQRMRQERREMLKQKSMRAKGPREPGNPFDTHFNGSIFSGKIQTGRGSHNTVYAR